MLFDYFIVIFVHMLGSLMKHFLSVTVDTYTHPHTQTHTHTHTHTHTPHTHTHKHTTTTRTTNGTVYVSSTTAVMEYWHHKTTLQRISHATPVDGWITYIEGSCDRKKIHTAEHMQFTFKPMGIVHCR